MKMKKRIDCSDCGQTFRAEGFKMGFAVMYVGNCPGCKKGYTCLSGTPGQVMAQSMIFADLFMDSAFSSAQVLGIPDPCTLEPEQIMAHAQA